MQYLYGSGEAAALSRQAYAALVGYVRERVAERRATRLIAPGKTPPTLARPLSAVLSPAATLAAPEWGACDAKPAAVVFDVDETVLLNTGYEYAEAATGQPYEAARWERWEQTGERAVRAVPGAAEALAALRGMGVTVVFNTNRSATNAPFTERALEGAGLGPARHGDTLFLKGDAPGGSGKDARRALIAARWCVVAMVGDQLGDFSDLFNSGINPAERRAAAQGPAFAERWGRGWFLLPNPVYGSGLAGGFDDVFPTDSRWTDPGAAKD